MADNSNNLYKRLKELAAVGKDTKSSDLTSKTLINYKRAADGTALGIIKENHNYYLKTSLSKGDNLSVADFAYIGGIENRRKYQYESVATADKHRESQLGIISEALTFRDAQDVPKNKLTESKQLPSLNIKENLSSYLKNRIIDGKKQINENFEERFKNNLKPTEKTETKKGLMSEEANFAIKKALGKLNESDLSTADSEIKDSDFVADKTGGKGKPQAPVNDSNAKSKANLGHSQPNDLTTSDSEIKDSDFVADKTGGKGKPQAPINDSNAKSKADAAKAKGHKVHESEDLVTADSEILDSDFIANKTGKDKPQAPINDSNAKTKANAGVSQPNDIITADSEIKDSDFIADKTGHEKPQAPVNAYNQPDQANKNKATTKPSEEQMRKVVDDKGKKETTNDIVAEGKKKTKVAEGVTVVGPTPQQGTPMPNVNSNTKFNTGKLEPGTSFNADEDAISEAGAADAELDAAANALQGLEMADANDDGSGTGDAGMEQTPMPTPDANPVPDEMAPDPNLGGAAPSPDAGAGLDAAAPAPAGEPSLDGLDLGTEGGADTEASPEAGLDAGAEEQPTDDESLGGAVDGNNDGDDSGIEKEIEKIIGKLGYKVRSAELSPEKTESSLNSIIAAFKNELSDIDIDARKSIANRIINPNKDEDGDDSTEGSDDMSMDSSSDPMADSGSEDSSNDFEANANEAIDNKIAKLKESGIPDALADDADSEEIETSTEEPEEENGSSFANYAKDRGYDPDNMGSSSEDEVGSVVGGWANDHGDDESQYQTVAIMLTPAVQKYLSDSGHGDFLQKLIPMLSGIGEDQMMKFGANEVMPQEDNMENTEQSEEEPQFAPAGQTMGAGIAKLGKSKMSSEEPETEEQAAEEEPTASNVDTEEESSTEEPEVEEKEEEVSESTKMLKKYIQMKLDERTGKRKAVLKEGKKSPTSILVDRILDEEIKNFKKKITENNHMTETEVNEISLGGLFNAGNAIGDMAKGVVNNAASAVKSKISSAATNLKSAGDQIVKSYHAGAKNAVVDDIEKMAVELGQLIAKLNASAVKAGEQPVNMKSILLSIQNQLSAPSKQPVNNPAKPVNPVAPTTAPSAAPKKPVNLSKFKTN